MSMMLLLSFNDIKHQLDRKGNYLRTQSGYNKKKEIARTSGSLEPSLDLVMHVSQRPLVARLLRANSIDLRSGETLRLDSRVVAQLVPLTNLLMGLGYSRNNGLGCTRTCKGRGNTSVLGVGGDSGLVVHVSKWSEAHWGACSWITSICNTGRDSLV